MGTPTGVIAVSASMEGVARRWAVAVVVLVGFMVWPIGSERRDRARSSG